MKDKIIVKNGKNYLASNYKEFNLLILLGISAIVLLVMVGAIAFISPFGGDEYLEVDDGYWDSMGYHVVGDVYVWESMASGGFQNTGDQTTIEVTKFVYDQLEEGNVIFLSLDSKGDYQYGGDIYRSVDSFLTTDDFLNDICLMYIFVLLYAMILFLMVVLGRKSAEVIILSEPEIIKKIRTWRGMYSYLKCDEGLFRLKDEYVYVTRDIGNLLHTDGDNPLDLRFYALKANLKKINDASFIIGNMMKDIEAEVNE